jgi:hypothetical protein
LLLVQGRFSATSPLLFFTPFCPESGLFSSSDFHFRNHLQQPHQRGNLCRFQYFPQLFVSRPPFFDEALSQY